MKKRIGILLLCMMVVLGVFPVTAQAADYPGFEAFSHIPMSACGTYDIQSDAWNEYGAEQVLTFATKGGGSIQKTNEASDGSWQTYEAGAYGGWQFRRWVVFYDGVFATGDKPTFDGKYFFSNAGSAGTALTVTNTTLQINKDPTARYNYYIYAIFDPIVKFEMDKNIADLGRMAVNEAQMGQLLENGVECACGASYGSNSFFFTVLYSAPYNQLKAKVTKNGTDITQSLASFRTSYGYNGILFKNLTEPATIRFSVELTTRKVSFSANGGSGSMQDVTLTFNQAQSLPGSGFTRPGWEFTGWNTQADGSGDSYSDRQTVTFTEPQSDSITLYAQWEKVPVAADFQFAAPENLYYTGQGKEASVTSPATGMGAITVNYYDSQGGKLSDLPEDVGTYSVAIDVEAGNGYTAIQGLTGTGWTFSIDYLPAPEPAYNLSGYETLAGGTYWYKGDGVAELAAPEDYAISTAFDGTYGASVAFSQDAPLTEVYLKRLSDGTMTDRIPVTETVVFDGNAPAFYGIANGGVYYGDKVFKAFDDESPHTLTLDGLDITSQTQGDDEYTIPADNQTHTLVVTDMAGNRAECSVTVYQIHTVTIDDGKNVQTQQVNHGDDVTLPELPEKEGYTAAWSHDGKNITADTAIRVVYTLIPQETTPEETTPEETTPEETTPEGTTPEGTTPEETTPEETTPDETTPITPAPSTPGTGDPVPVGLLLLAVFLSAMGLLTLTRKKKA